MSRRNFTVGRRQTRIARNAGTALGESRSPPCLRVGGRHCPCAPACKRSSLGSGLAIARAVAALDLADDGSDRRAET